MSKGVEWSSKWVFTKDERLDSWNALSRVNGKEEEEEKAWRSRTRSVSAVVIGERTARRGAVFVARQRVGH